MQNNYQRKWFKYHITTELSENPFMFTGIKLQASMAPIQM